MKVMFAVVILAFAVYANANAVGQVVDVAHQGASVGSYGPALINSGWNNGGWNNGGWNNGGWGNGGWGNGGWNNGGWGNGAWGNEGWGNGGWGYGGPIGIGGHGLPSLSVNGWGAYGGAHGHEGKYVASNRGATHVAPLVGHVQSVTSENKSPAPGTTW